MKVTCESCETRYSVPEERVAGKVVLIRCKECRNVMRVVGPSDHFDIDVHIPPPTLTHVVPANFGLDVGAPIEEPIWWVGIEGRPHGPYNQSDIEALVQRGDVHARSLMWASPWHQWERVAESPALGWVVELCLKSIGNAADAAIDDGRATTDHFNNAGILGDSGGYFPDPTLHTGWLVLDERTQHSLETWAQRAEHPVQSRKGPIVGAAAAFATGVMMAAFGIVWLAQTAA